MTGRTSHGANEVIPAAGIWPLGHVVVQTVVTGGGDWIGRDDFNLPVPVTTWARVSWKHKARVACGRPTLTDMTIRLPGAAVVDMMEMLSTVHIGS